jgi:hypothetical protein
MRCRNAQILLTKQLRETLTPEQSASLAQHVAACPACCVEKVEMEKFTAQLLQAKPSPAPMRASVAEQIRGRVRQSSPSRWTAHVWRSVFGLATAVGMVLFIFLLRSAPPLSAQEILERLAAGKFEIKSLHKVGYRLWGKERRRVREEEWLRMSDGYRHDFRGDIEVWHNGVLTHYKAEEKKAYILKETRDLNSSCYGQASYFAEVARQTLELARQRGDLSSVVLGEEMVNGQPALVLRLGKNRPPSVPYLWVDKRTGLPVRSARLDYKKVKTVMNLESLHALTEESLWGGDTEYNVDISDAVFTPKLPDDAQVVDLRPQQERLLRQTLAQDSRQGFTATVHDIETTEEGTVWIAVSIISPSDLPKPLSVGVHHLRRDVPVLSDDVGTEYSSEVCTAQVVGLMWDDRRFYYLPLMPLVTRPKNAPLPSALTLNLTVQARQIGKPQLMQGHWGTPATPLADVSFQFMLPAPPPTLPRDGTPALVAWQKDHDFLGILAQIRGDDLMRRGRYADAIASFAQAVAWRKPPYKGIPFFLQAKAEMKAGRTQDAKKHLRELLDRQMLPEESVMDIHAGAARELLKRIR